VAQVLYGCVVVTLGVMEVHHPTSTHGVKRFRDASDSLAAIDYGHVCWVFDRVYIGVASQPPDMRRTIIKHVHVHREPGHGTPDGVAP